MRVVARCLVLAACLGSLSFGASALTNADLDAVKRTWNQGGQVQALQQLERSIEDAEANERFESPQVRSLSYWLLARARLQRDEGLASQAAHAYQQAIQAGLLEHHPRVRRATERFEVELLRYGANPRQPVATTAPSTPAKAKVNSVSTNVGTRANAPAAPSAPVFAAPAPVQAPPEVSAQERRADSVKNIRALAQWAEGYVGLLPYFGEAKQVVLPLFPGMSEDSDALLYLVFVFGYALFAYQLIFAVVTLPFKLVRDMAHGSSRGVQLGRHTACGGASHHSTGKSTRDASGKRPKRMVRESPWG